MNLATLALADAAITFLWVVYVAFMRPAAVLIASSLDLRGYEFPITLGLLALNIFIFSWLGGTWGGAIWNPAPVLAFYSVGKSKDSLFTIAVRIPAQIVGAVGGTLAAKELIPPSYSHLLRGPQLMVDLHKGILAELVLTFIINLGVLFALLKGPHNQFLKTWIIILVTIAVLLLGADYTGPSLNPANAFGWAYVKDNYYSKDHLLVYWLAPLAGAWLASLVFQMIFSIDKPKEKEA